MIRARPRSPLWLVVLGMAAEAPMHPYRMQALIKTRGKDQIANVAQRNSVYQTIDALRRAGLIAVRETARTERRPERTVYEATPDGRRTLRTWVETMLSTPAREFPGFPAALSMLMVLPPNEVRAALETRVGALDRRIADLEQPHSKVPRLFLLENEYMAAVARAERDWLRRVLADLASGKLAWDDAWLRRVAAELDGGSGTAPSVSPLDTSGRPASRRAASRRQSG